MLILAETAAGYALFQAKDKLVKKDVRQELSSAEKTAAALKLQAFRKFENTADALDNVSAIIDGKVSPALASLLKDVKDKESLVVADAKLGNAINKVDGLKFNIVADSTTHDIYRAIREHMSSLISGLSPEDLSTMSLGLSHSLSRHKLKFSPDKVDTMIVQAIALLDDLDKELNTYAMRVKEWYGWHFPEMARIVQDNMAYARVIKKMGMRTSCADTDFSDTLPEEIEQQLKQAAEISMGTEITDEDLENINLLAEQVLSLSEYRIQLSEYLKNRMNAIAPNLTVLVGELVGARLIAHAGSLMSLAKQPASTIQILGAEKALFRALKTKHDTPKYGLIYHASLIGQASNKSKAKIARVLATKAALGLRIDALGEEEGNELGFELRAKVEARLRALDGIKALPEPSVQLQRSSGQQAKFQLKAGAGYSASTDAVQGTGLAPTDPVEKKSSSKKRKEVELDEAVEEIVANGAEVEESKEARKERKRMEKEAKKSSKKAKLAIDEAEQVNGGEETEAERKARRKAEKAAKKAAKQ
ncbi:Nucleolar protein 58 [Savitreella phatthalungensis]